MFCAGLFSSGGETLSGMRFLNYRYFVTSCQWSLHILHFLFCFWKVFFRRTWYQIDRYCCRILARCWPHCKEISHATCINLQICPALSYFDAVQFGICIWFLGSNPLIRRDNSSLGSHLSVRKFWNVMSIIRPWVILKSLLNGQPVEAPYRFSARPKSHLEPHVQAREARARSVCDTFVNERLVRY